MQQDQNECHAYNDIDIMDATCMSLARRIERIFEPSLSRSQAASPFAFYNLSTPGRKSEHAPRTSAHLDADIPPIPSSSHRAGHLI